MKRGKPHGGRGLRPVSALTVEATRVRDIAHLSDRPRPESSLTLSPSV
jgi:hypothetical protein